MSDEQTQKQALMFVLKKKTKKQKEQPNCR